MADPTIPAGHRDGTSPVEYLRSMGVNLEGDFLTQVRQLLARAAFELEVEQQIGVGQSEHCP